jgi:hypothetical protein
MFLFFIFTITSNILKILYKSDIDAYYAGYYHSLEHSIHEPEMGEYKHRMLLNRLQIHYENKALMDSLLDPKISSNKKLAKINNPIKIDALDIKKGGLFNDWKFEDF